MPPTQAAAELLQTTLTVKDIGRDKDVFEFRIPSLQDDIRVGSRVQTLRRRIDPDWDGFTEGLDAGTFFSLRAAATFELLLVKSSAKWPFGDTSGSPSTDSSKFPPDRVSDVYQAYQGFIEALSTFRAGGSANQDPPGSEGVAG